jgi:hypothetical protein
MVTDSYSEGPATWYGSLQLASKNSILCRDLRQMLALGVLVREANS